MSETIIKVQDLYKELPYGFWGKKKPVLKNISFEVFKHDVVGFIGVNGAGKTTTMKCMLGFIYPDKGDINFFDQSLDKIQLKSKIGYMPERPYFYEFLTGREFLKLHWDLSQYGGESDFETRMDKVLTQVDLLRAKDMRLRSFSKGMLQRIGIAQSIIHEPELIILDEPMSGLDPDGRFLVKNIIKDEAQKGTTIFFSSHLLQDMEEICTKLVVIDDGELLFIGTIDSFKGMIEKYDDKKDGAISLEKAFQLWRKNKKHLS